MGGTTLAKCRPSLEKPAPSQTVTISSLSAMIMSVNGKTAKNTSAGRYCSPRAARKITLSRSPQTTSKTIAGTSSAGATTPAVFAGTAADSESLCVPGSTSGTITATMSARYSPTSSTVRRSPAVNGTRFHGRSRIVPVRAQNRMPPVIGLNLPASGPHDPATPIVSSSTVHSTAFSYTIG